MLLRLLVVVGLAMFVEAASPAETEACLDCHADKGHALEFTEGGRIEAFVDEGQFKASVHAFLACTDCHDRALTGKGHEERRFRNEALFKIRYSRICRRCHEDPELAASAVHADLLEQEAAGRTAVCTDCHPAHAIRPVTGGPVAARAAAACEDCHPAQARERSPGERTGGTAGVSRSVHVQLACPGCHVGYSPQSHPGIAAPVAAPGTAPDELCRPCHADLYSRAQEGIHHALRTRGQAGTPGCIDCHGSHRTTSLSDDPAASAAKCGECHARLYATYASSVHGDALVHAHNRDVPACTDCHRAHDTGDPRTAGFRFDIPLLCGNCHANDRIVGRYGLSSDVVRSYLSDFHGRTVSLYREQAAADGRTGGPVVVCTDCHGTHDIRSMSALGTGGIKARLLDECRKCHADASVDFPDAWLPHYSPSLSRTPALFFVDWAYRVLLPLMLLGMLLHVVLHARHHVFRAAGGPATARDGGAAQDGESGTRIRRFSTGRILEHLLLILLVVTLAATGLAQKFHQLGVSQWLLATVGGVDVARLVHRGAGTLLAILLLVHVTVAVIGVTLRGWYPSMLATPQDLRDAVRDTRYGLGLETRPAGRGRYDYKEKFTYWLILIGIAIMVLTGLALWFPVAAARLLPAEAIPLAASLHRHQTLVVLLLAVAWHVYDAIFSPDEFPLDASIFTGYATRRRSRPEA